VVIRRPLGRGDPCPARGVGPIRKSRHFDVGRGCRQNGSFWPRWSVQTSRRISRADSACCEIWRIGPKTSLRDGAIAAYRTWTWREKVGGHRPSYAERPRGQAVVSGQRRSGVRLRASTNGITPAPTAKGPLIDIHASACRGQNREQRHCPIQIVYSLQSDYLPLSQVIDRFQVTYQRTRDRAPQSRSNDHGTATSIGRCTPRTAFHKSRRFGSKNRTAGGVYALEWAEEFENGRRCPSSLGKADALSSRDQCCGIRTILLFGKLRPDSP